MGENPLKSRPYRLRGDSLEVSLRDFSYSRIYHREISANDERKVGDLLSDLENKGVPISKALSKKKVPQDDW